MESHEKPCMLWDGLRERKTVCIEQKYFLFYLFYFIKGIYWFLLVGASKVSWLSSSQSPVKSQRYNKLRFAEHSRLWIISSPCTVYRELGVHCSVWTADRRVRRKIVAAVDSLHLLSVLHINNARTHTHIYTIHFPLMDVSASVCCSLICTLYQCNQLWE